MNIMENCMRCMRLSRILTERQPSGGQLTVKWLICMFFLVQFIAPQVLYMCTKADNIIEIATIFYAIVTIFGNAVQFVLLHAKRSAVQRFVDDLQRFVNANIRANGTDNFERTEHAFTIVSRIVIRLAYASYILYIVKPAAVQVHAVVAGTVTNETFVAPFNDIYYFFDASQSPMFELCYAATTAGLFVALTILLTVDLLFFGMTLYTVAMYAELEYLLGEAKRIATDDESMHEHLIKCVRFHIAILRFIRAGNHIFSGIIFVQFVYSLFVLVTNVFAASYAGFGETCIFAIHFTLLASELFLFCWTGSMVLNKANRLRECVYDLNWYDYRLPEKRLVHILILRTMLPAGFSAFEWIYCNTDTFMEVISNVFSALAFLKSIV